MSLEFIVINDIASRRTSRNVSRHIVLGRTKPAGRNDNIRALQRIANRFFKPGFIITDDRLQLHLDADVHQLLGKPQTIRVGPLRSQ